MGAFSDLNGVFLSEGYNVQYNNDRDIFRNNSARNLYSQTNYFPRGTDDIVNKPIENYFIVPNYVTDVSYLFFNTRNADARIYPKFSENVKNVSHAFSYQGLGLFNGGWDPNNGLEGPEFPDSIEDASGIFKCSYYMAPLFNFVRNMPNNLITLNNAFFYTGTCNGLFFPNLDRNNNFILDDYKNLFDIWSNYGSLYGYQSNFTYPMNYYYNNENKRFMNSTIPDSVQYMNGTFALSSIGIDWYDGARNNDIEFHLPNNLKDASFCFFNTSYTTNFRFTLPDSLTEANYMFGSAYGYNFPNKVTFGNGLINAVGMFAQLAYGSAIINNFEDKFPGGLPDSIVNASKMFSGCNVSDIINIPRGVEDASFFLCAGGFAGYSAGNWNNNDYIIPNTVKNIAFAFSNLNISPNNNNMRLFFEDYEYNPQKLYWSPCSRYNNTHFIFEEGTELESLQGMLVGCNLNRPLEVPNSVKDISFLLCAGGTNYANLGGEDFFNNVLKENVENAAWAFCYGYLGDTDTNIYMPPNLKNAVGMFCNLYTNTYCQVNFVNLENTQIDNAAWFLNGAYNFNSPINFPTTVKSFYRTFNGCRNWTGHYDDWTFNLAEYPNLENCDYMFFSCNNYNLPTTFPSGLKSLEGVFGQCQIFNQFVTIPEGVVSAKDLFTNCRNFDQVIALPASLEIADNMFNGCSNFNFGGLDLNFSNLTNLVSMNYMFNNCGNLNKVLNEQTFQWPPHVEQISGLFNNCRNIEIETFVIPGSVKYGKDILNNVTVSDSIYIQKGYEYLDTPFTNLRGKYTGDDGNYYINSVTIECGDGNIVLGRMPTFFNTNVNTILFKDGNLSFWSLNPNNGVVNNSSFYIGNSNKFNGNIEFDNVEYIFINSGNFSITNCQNFDKPINFPALVSGSLGTKNYRHTILGNYNEGNYLVIYHNTNPSVSPQYEYSMAYDFAENNTAFKESLNSLINSKQDYWNIFNNLNNYSFEEVKPVGGMVRPSIINSCPKFNSPISFDYGTTYLTNILQNCLIFNQPITVPSTVDQASRVIQNCPNFDQSILIPGSVKNASYFISNCTKFNAAPIFGSGIEDLSGFFLNLYNYNARTYLPDTILDGNNLFANCFNYNQETEFFGGRNLSSALRNCTKYNSNTSFGYSEYRNIDNLFFGDSIFDKDIDFNCRTIVNASNAFAFTKISGDVRNCNFPIEFKNHFSNGYISDARNNEAVLKALELQQHNAFYYPNFYAARDNINFYHYISEQVVKDAASLFKGCSNYNSSIVPDLSGVKFANEIFMSCSNYNQPVNLYSANYISNAFNGAYKFNQSLTFNNYILEMSDAFYSCYDLVAIPKFLNGINISATSYNSQLGKTMGGSLNAFYSCYNLGIGQEGFEHAITFQNVSTSNSGTTLRPGSYFFAYCQNLNVPIIFNTGYSHWMPPAFLVGCTNYNSNIVFNRVNNYRNYNITNIVNNFSSNLPYEIIEENQWSTTAYSVRFNYLLLDDLGGCASFFATNSYNRFPEFVDNNGVTVSEFYFNSLYGELSQYPYLVDKGLFELCDTFNYPIQRHFIPINRDYMEYYENYRNENRILPRTGWINVVKNCPNFNQPILSYYFDSPESLALNTGIAGSFLGLDFTGCTNFNQPIVGNFTFKNNYSFFGMNMFFEGCTTPGDIRINFIANNERNFSSGREISVLFSNMKTPIESTHRNLYLKGIVEDGLNATNLYIRGVYAGGQSNPADNLSELTYENFVPENIYIDVVGNIPASHMISFSRPILQYCNYYPSFYYSAGGVVVTNNLQNNQIIKNLQFYPSWDRFNYYGAYNSSSRVIYNRPLLYYVDCGYIDLWNTFLNRNSNFNYVNDLFYMVKNVHQDFHFEADSAVNFNNANNVFIFGDNCEVNIYINSFKSFVNVNFFASIGNNYDTRGSSIYSVPMNSNVNVFIKGGLTYYANNFFNTIGYDSNNRAICSPTYYIEPGTTFYSCSTLPKKLATNLNLSQFQGLTQYNFYSGRYAINSNIDISTYSIPLEGMVNTIFEGNGNIIFNPATMQRYNQNVGPLYLTGGCRNFVINSTYSGATTFTNLFRGYYSQFYNDLLTYNLIDETNTRANLYVKNGSTLATYLKQDNHRAFNIFYAMGQVSWDNNVIEVEELEDRFHYIWHIDNTFRPSEPTYDLHYNIVFY